MKSVNWVIGPFVFYHIKKIDLKNNKFSIKIKEPKKKKKLNVMDHVKLWAFSCIIFLVACKIIKKLYFLKR